jgi:hypothetical protein
MWGRPPSAALGRPLERSSTVGDFTIVQLHAFVEPSILSSDPEVRA